MRSSQRKTTIVLCVGLSRGFHTSGFSKSFNSTLATRVALVGRLAIPTQRLGVVLPNSPQPLSYMTRRLVWPPRGLGRLISEYPTQSKERPASQRQTSSGFLGQKLIEVAKRTQR